MRRMYRYGLLEEGQNQLDYVLALLPADFLERRLQTLVFKLGLAKSIHHARVLIRQRHIRCGALSLVSGSCVWRVEWGAPCQVHVHSCTACSCTAWHLLTICPRRSRSTAGQKYGCFAQCCLLTVCMFAEPRQGGQADRERAVLHGACGQPEAHRLCAQQPLRRRPPRPQQAPQPQVRFCCHHAPLDRVATGCQYTSMP